MGRGLHSSRLLILLVPAVAIALAELLLWTTSKVGVLSSKSTSFTAGKAANHGFLHAAGTSRDRSRVTLYQQADNTKVQNVFDLSQGLVIDTSNPGRRKGSAYPTKVDNSDFGETGDDRKLRSAISSIARDQENLRMGTPISTGKTVLAAATALMLAITASATATIPLWHQVLLPAITSGLFLQTSVSESKGTEAKGLARHNSAQSCVLTSQQKALKAQAEYRKAFLPLGVGLTAIFAAAAASLKLFNEKIGDLLPEDNINPPLLAADNFLMVCFAVAAVIGAMRTGETYLNMRAALTFKEGDTTDAAKSEARWMLPSEARDPSDRERMLVNVLTLLLCVLPLPFLFRGTDFAALSEREVGAFNKEFQEFIDSACVVISATAGAQAATVVLIAELEWADLERRVAIQGRQAALSELFFAQTQAESAAIPAKSAWSGMMLAIASLAVEFSTFASGISPWPAVLSSVKSFVSAKLTSSSADASWIERKLQKTRPVSAGQNALGSTTREIGQLLSTLTSTNELSNSMRGRLVALPLGGTLMFEALGGESRRKVHLLAAELGMVSQSVPGKRAVAVTNFGGAKIDTEETFMPASLAKAAQGALVETQQTVMNIAERGIPPGEGTALVPALAATAAGVAAHSVFGETGADFAIPLLTGVVSLTTVLQEQSGIATMSLAKEKVAKTKQQISKAESLLGRGILAGSIMPTYLAIATAATTVSVILFMEATPRRLWWMSAVLLGITTGATALAARRQKRVAFYIKQASQAVGGTPPPSSWIGRKRWWVAPLAIAMAVPCDLPRRMTIAMAILATEIAMMMSSTFTRAAAASFYAARADRVYARGEAWASQADVESCALPKNSAAAICTTLLSVTVATFDTPLGGIFPVLGLGICLQAVQSRVQASRSAKLADIEASDIQRFGSTEMPPFMQRAVPTEQLSSSYIASVKPVKYTSADVGLLDNVVPTISADLQREGQTVDQLYDQLSVGKGEITWSTFRKFFEKFDEGKLSSQEIERLWLVFDKNMSGGVSRSELQAILGKRLKGKSVNAFRKTGFALRRGAMSILEGKSRADEYYRTSAAEKAVEGVQASLVELRLSIKANEKDWLRTGAAVGTAVTASILAPFLLSEVLTEVLLPVVGAALVLFAVDAQAESQIKIAKGEIWAAELTEIAATQEELLAIGGLYKARLITVTALSVCVAIATIALEEPFGIFEMSPLLGIIQNIIRWGLIITQAVCSLWSMGRYLTVLEWTKRVNSRMSVIASPGGVASEQEETPNSWFQGRRESGALNRSLPALVSILPVVFFTIFPMGGHFAKRAVASTAAGAVVVALALYGAERAFARAELSQAARLRTSALAEVFCEEAEKQSALLPFVSAGTIAVAGAITFATEINPVFAAGLTLLQALGWVVASRKGVAATFQSEAALKVNLNTTIPRINPGKDPLKRIKRWLMK